MSVANSAESIGVRGAATSTVEYRADNRSLWENMKQQTLGFIGAGNMASSLIAGLLADGYLPSNIWASDVDPDKLKSLSNRWGVQTTSDNKRVVEHAQIVVLAIKPQMMQGVLTELADTVQRHKPLIISLAAGVLEADIDSWLGEGNDIVRCMPNTPALVKTGATALHGSDRLSSEQRSRAEAVLRAVGIAVWVETEELLDVVTALSGSGPAYFFYSWRPWKMLPWRWGLRRTRRACSRSRPH